MRSIIIGLAVLMAVSTSGCGEKKRLEGELAQSKARIAELDSTLTKTEAQSRAMTRSMGDSLRAVAQDIERTRAKSDSLERSYQIASGKAKRLQKDLTTARTEFQKSLDSLQSVRYALDSTVRTQEAKLRGAENQVASLQRDIDRVSGEKDSVLRMIDKAKPWFDYYRAEAHRSWIKKLFGAGRAKKPQIPEPALVPPVFEQPRIDSTPPARTELEMPVVAPQSNVESGR